MDNKVAQESTNHRPQYNKTKMGHLTLLFGCMFAQKTTELIRRIRRYESIGMHVLVINYKGDTRYTNEQKIATHDRVMCDAISLTTLEEAKPYLNEKKYDVLIIDEAQFFKDLYINVTQWADNLQMQIVVCGLDGDSERRPFGDILRLIPHAEEVERLTAFCSMCRDGTPATFTKYLDNRKKEENEVAIGSGEVYTPVCRFHYLENK